MFEENYEICDGPFPARFSVTLKSATEGQLKIAQKLMNRYVNKDGLTHTTEGKMLKFDFRVDKAPKTSRKRAEKWKGFAIAGEWCTTCQLLAQGFPHVQFCCLLRSDSRARAGDQTCYSCLLAGRTDCHAVAKLNEGIIPGLYDPSSLLYNGSMNALEEANESDSTLKIHPDIDKKNVDMSDIKDSIKKIETIMEERIPVLQAGYSICQHVMSTDAPIRESSCMPCGEDNDRDATEDTQHNDVSGGDNVAHQPFSAPLSTCLSIEWPY